MSGSGMSRLFAVSYAMGATTAFRVGASSMKLWSEQAPKMLDLWLKAGEDTADATKHEKQLRDELFKAARDATRNFNAEVLGGIDDVDRFTKPKPSSPPAAPAAARATRRRAQGSGRSPGVSR